MKPLIRHRYSQKTYLFIVYGSFILILLAIFFFFTYNHYYTTTFEEVKKDNLNLSTSIADAIDTQLDNLSTISLNVVYSNAIKTNFSEFSKLYPNADHSVEDLTSSWDRVRYLHDTITAIIGAYQSASQVNLYTMDGYSVEVGYWPRIRTVELDTLSWYDETLALNGHKYISPPYTNNLLPVKSNNQETHQFLSMTRVFFKGDHAPEGIVEVVQDCGIIFSLTQQLIASNPHAKAVIYNARGEQIYPYVLDSSPLSPSYLEAIDTNHLSPSTPTMVKRGNSLEMITYLHLPDYDWTVVVTLPNDAVYAPLRSFRLLFIIIAILSVFSTLLVAFYISKRMTEPLHQLTKATGVITIDSVLDSAPLDVQLDHSSIEEVALLYESIHNMYRRLQQTTKEAMLSHSEETKAKLLATQSLINPHFLYNSLTTISVMAEEQMNAEIIGMAQSLCDYFRYVSSNSSMFVPLSEELLHTEKYLACMGFRYDGDFIYDMDQPSFAHHTMVPKLIIQPIIENAFKHAFLGTPPWHLKISATLKNGHWTIRIADNAGILDTKKASKLMEDFEALSPLHELGTMEIGGMGLKNVQLRLKLLYGDDAVFRIETYQHEETAFVIGGPCLSEKEMTYERGKTL